MDAKIPNSRRAAPDWMTRSLERSESQVDAGLTVPLDPVLERARASIERIKAARANEQKARPKT